MKIRTAIETDYPEILDIAEQERYLVRHTTYTYWLIQKMDPEAVLVADSDGEVTGFVAGIFDFQGPDRSMLVQIAISPTARRTGLGRKLVEHFAARSLAKGKSSILFTISPKNSISEQFFEAIARDNHTVLRSLGTTGTLGGTLDEENLWEIILDASIHFITTVP